MTATPTLRALLNAFPDMADSFKRPGFPRSRPAKSSSAVVSNSNRLGTGRPDWRWKPREIAIPVESKLAAKPLPTGHRDGKTIGKSLVGLLLAARYRRRGNGNDDVDLSRTSSAAKFRQAFIVAVGVSRALDDGGSSLQL
jgi:hypothetical protein